MNDVIENGNAYPLATEAGRWTPVLRGKEYCSPACGARCKKADFDNARVRAGALARELGPGWQPHVWENGGWHYEVKKSNGAVYEEDGEYRADLRFSFGTDTQLLVSETRPNAPAAIAAVIARVEADIAVLRRQMLSMAPTPLEIEDARYTVQEA